MFLRGLIGESNANDITAFPLNFPVAALEVRTKCVLSPRAPQTGLSWPPGVDPRRAGCIVPLRHTRGGARARDRQLASQIDGLRVFESDGPRVFEGDGQRVSEIYWLCVSERVRLCSNNRNARGRVYLAWGLSE